MEEITAAGTNPEQTSLVPADLIERAKEYARQSKSPATLRAYKAIWRIFTAWCEARELSPLPASPETVVAYIADQADHIKPVTLKKHLAAVSSIHKLRGYDSPVQSEPVRLTMAGLRRVKGVASKPKRALRVEHVRKMVETMPDDLVGVRDRAIILVGIVTGMRRSEIVSLDVSDLTFEPEGVVLTIRKSKRDQEGRGRQVAVLLGRHEATCPVRAVRRWLSESELKVGPLFVRLDPAGARQRLAGKAVARIVKRAAARSGLDATMFAGHSLRRGFASETARAGASERSIARTTGHRSLTVLRGYVEAGTIFEDAAAKHLDL